MCPQAAEECVGAFPRNTGGIYWITGHTETSSGMMQVLVLTRENSVRKGSLSCCADLTYTSLSPELLVEFCSALCSKRIYTCKSSYRIRRKNSSRNYTLTEILIEGCIQWGQLTDHAVTGMLLRMCLCVFHLRVV